jgi:hypothetical protein
MTRVRGFLVVGLCGIAAFAATALRAGAGGRAASPESVPSAPTAAEYDSATVVVAGTLSDAVRASLTAADAHGRAFVVVLGPDDVRQCEDLGRQLRDVQDLAGAPLLVVSEPGTEEDVRVFLRRERLRGTAVPLRAAAVLEETTELATPAVLVAAWGSSVTGIAHPRRFANARVRSFAEELAALDPSLSSWRDE